MKGRRPFWDPRNNQFNFSTQVSALTRINGYTPTLNAMNAEHDLSILTNFLRRMVPDVEGHDMGDPPEDVMPRLDAFAAGKADAKERSALAELLKQHPEYLRYLGKAIRNKAA